MLPAEVASGAVVEAFAATVSYRLEPDGIASRFPVVLDHLLAGRLNPYQAGAALVELEEIEQGLRSLPAASVVFSLADLSRRDDPRAEVNRSAQDACSFFVAADGRPLVDVLREGVMAARTSGRPLGLSTPRAAAGRVQAWILIGGGLAWVLAVAAFLPRWVIVPHGSGGNAHGPALWTLGVVAVGAGAVRLAAVERPAFAAGMRSHGALTVALSLAAAFALLAIAWR